MRHSPIITSLFLFMAITWPSQGQLPEEEPSNQGHLLLRTETHEKVYLGKGRPKWGLALSGGGLRSALFSFGALKRFYDDRILQNIDVISTVSGGGYTGCQVYLNEIANKSLRKDFGTATFHDSRFLEIMVNNALTGNFVTFPQMLGTGFRRKNAIKLYNGGILRSFSPQDGGLEYFDKMTMGRPGISNLPYLIVNATVMKPRPTGFNDGVYEFTPLHVGTGDRGYRKWAHSMPFVQAITISGAATRPFLKQTIPDPGQRDNPEMLTLSDGGHSENLGAFSLFRRGVQNVIIVDAEHDPAYEFGAYVNLRDRLRQWNSTFKIAGIEEVIASKTKQKELEMGGKAKTNLYRGVVNSTAENGEAVRTNVFYLKMSLAETVSREISKDTRVTRGSVAHHGAISYLEENALPNGEWNPKLLNDIGIDFEAWLAYQVTAYPKVIDALWRVKLLRLIPWKAPRINFPQYSTFDQSFYLNQSLAFIGLGYFSAIEMKPAIERSR